MPSALSLCVPLPLRQIFRSNSNLMMIMTLSTILQQSDANLYGTHPFFMCVEENGDAFGVLLYNSNAMGKLKFLHGSIFGKMGRFQSIKERE